jgi:hypothetical protein
MSWGAAGFGAQPIARPSVAEWSPSDTPALAEHAPVTCVTLLASAAASVVSLAGRRGTPLDVVRVVGVALTTAVVTDHSHLVSATQGIRAGSGLTLTRCVASQLVFSSLSAWARAAVPRVCTLGFFSHEETHSHCSGVRLRLWLALPLPRL